MTRLVALLVALALPMLAQGQAGVPSAATRHATTPAQVDAKARARPPARDGLGTRLPAGLERGALIDLFKLPRVHANLVSLVGARPWSARPDSYVAVICLMQNGQRQPGVQECRPSVPDNVPPAIYVGVIEMPPGAAPRLLARSDLIDRTTSWHDTLLPAVPSLAKRDSHLRAAPQTWDRVDLAPYRIREQSTAFGVRATWNETYGYGFGQFEALYLFELDGDRVRLILAEPMGVRQLLVGDYRSDAPRDMDEVEDSNVIVVGKVATEGYFNLQVKTRVTGQTRHFTWSSEHHEYRAPMTKALPN